MADINQIHPTVDPNAAPKHDKIKEALQFLKKYLKNPVQTMRELPDWDWPMLVIFYMSFAGSCGIIGGVLSRHISRIIIGAIFSPIFSLAGAALATGFLYYTFTFFYQRQIAIKTLFTIVILSMLPFLAIYALSFFLTALNLVGLLASGILLVVGLSENTHIERKRIFKLVAAIYAVYVVFWIVTSIRSQSEKEEYKDHATRDAIETIKKDMGN